MEALMTLTRSTLAPTMTAAFALGLILTGCSTTPSPGVQATPTAGVALHPATAPSGTAGVAASPSAAELTSQYRTSTGVTIRMDPNRSLPADVVADLHVRLPAAIPLTLDASLPVAVASEAAVEAVEGAGREMVGILQTGTYDQATGAVDGQAWTLVLRPDLRPAGDGFYNTVESARAAAEAVIAVQPNPEHYDIVDLTD
jgi:hypothetical protein